MKSTDTQRGTRPTRSLRLVSSDRSLVHGGHGTEEDSDAELLDAYSRAVISVVEHVAPSVAAVFSQSKRGEGIGSGVLITPDGYLITNDHVIDGSVEVGVELPEGARVAADVIGRDAATDLALLRVQASGLPFSSLARHQRLRVGQLVVAIGNPLGFSETVSAGIVSAKGRALRARNGHLIDGVVQHTAPLNPGNSGGPLVNTDDKVVGINTAIIAMAQGIGFAIPADTAEWVVTEILNHGRVRRAQLGIRARTRPISVRSARIYKVAQESVVEVMEVVDGSPASRAGVALGDLIFEVNGVSVHTVDALLKQLGEAASLQLIELTVGRRGRISMFALRPELRRD